MLASRRHSTFVAVTDSNLINPTIRWLRWAPILVVVAIAAFAIVAIRSFREPVLRAAGWALVL